MSLSATAVTIIEARSFSTDTATTESYTLSLHDALPIFGIPDHRCQFRVTGSILLLASPPGGERSEEHTSELQSLAYLVCRLLLEKVNEWGCLLGVFRPRVSSQLHSRRAALARCTPVSPG